MNNLNKYKNEEQFILILKKYKLSKENPEFFNLETDLFSFLNQAFTKSFFNLRKILILRIDEEMDEKLIIKLKNNLADLKDHKNLIFLVVHNSKLYLFKGYASEVYEFEAFSKYSLKKILVSELKKHKINYLNHDLDNLLNLSQNQEIVLNELKKIIYLNNLNMENPFEMLFKTNEKIYFIIFNAFIEKKFVLLEHNLNEFLLQNGPFLLVDFFIKYLHQIIIYRSEKAIFSKNDFLKSKFVSYYYNKNIEYLSSQKSLIEWESLLVSFLDLKNFILWNKSDNLIELFKMKMIFLAKLF